MKVQTHTKVVAVEIDLGHGNCALIFERKSESMVAFAVVGAAGQNVAEGMLSESEWEEFKAAVEKI